MSEKTVREQADILGKMFDVVISKKYGSCVAPEPIIMQTGIRHLDTLLGGGFMSSGPIMISSAPETGKSTVAFQLSGIFHSLYENGIVVYIDIEGSGNSEKSNKIKLTRTSVFGLANSNRFRHYPVVLTISELFDLIDSLIEQKKMIEEKTKREFYVFIVWDSVAATRSTRTDEVEDHNKIIGFKSRELSFQLEKHLPLLKFNRVFFVCIDQVRAKLNIEGPYVQKERSVGQFKDLQAASGTYSLLHNIQQWIFLSKKSQFNKTEGFGFDGWYLDIFTEKNKLAPSQYAVTCVFDNFRGLDKFWSEYIFLSELTPTEKKVFKNGNPPFPLSIIKANAQKYILKIENPEDTSIKYESKPFYKKEAKHLYETNEEFKQWFDYAVELSCSHRLLSSMYREDISSFDGVVEEEDESCISEENSLF